jgi:hypothetical protein
VSALDLAIGRCTNTLKFGATELCNTTKEIVVIQTGLLPLKSGASRQRAMHATLNRVNSGQIYSHPETADCAFNEARRWRGAKD